MSGSHNHDQQDSKWDKVQMIHLAHFHTLCRVYARGSSNTSIHCVGCMPGVVLLPSFPILPTPSSPTDIIPILPTLHLDSSQFRISFRGTILGHMGPLIVSAECSVTTISCCLFLCH